MSEWYKKRFRRTLLDMHIEDWDESFLSEYDPNIYFQALKKAHIDAVMIYVQSHVGLCYWPTQVGVMHSSFIGKENQVKQLFDLCKNEGIDVVLYYSLLFNNREYERHPEWRMRDANGEASRDNGMRYGLCCPNNAAYVDFIYAQIEEFSAFFDYQGVFFDMTFWQEVCYCDSCKSRWEKEVGGEMPTVVDWNNPAWCMLNKKQHEWLGEFGKKLTEKAKQMKPGITVEHQYGHSIDYWRFGNNENIAEISDYIGTDLYGGIKQQSFACKTWYNITKNQPFQYMTSRCYPNLSEHTNTKTKDQLIQCIAMTYLHHGASFLIDAIDPVGTIDNKVYDLIGEIYSETKSYEKYFSRGKMVYDIGLYFNLNGKMDVEVNGIDIMDYKLKTANQEGAGMPHVEALLGASGILASNFISYGIVNNARLDLINNCKVLVLPDVPKMQKTEIEYIKNYVKTGGKLYMSGHSAPELLEEFFGVQWKGYTDEAITYMAPTEEDQFIGQFFTKKHPLVMLEKSVLVEGEVKGKVHATLTLPYTVPNHETFISPTEIPPQYFIDSKSPMYLFSSIHANPPGINKNIPTLLENEYGQGKVIWSSLVIERANRYQHGKIFTKIIEYLLEGRAFFGGEASESVECVVFDAVEHNQVLVGVIETRECYCIPETTGTKIRIRINKNPISVLDLSDSSTISYTYQDGIVEFEIDKFHIWKMIVINY